MVGLDSKGQKLESPKADKVAQSEPAPNPLANLDPEQLKTLLAKAANPSLDSKAVAEEKKDNKVAEGLGQMLGGGSETRKKNESNISSIKILYSYDLYPFSISILIWHVHKFLNDFRFVD